MKWLIQYSYEIKLDKAILWCCLIWYLVVVCFHFDPSPKIWINSIGISIVIGTGLLLSVSSSEIGKRNNWQTFQLYLMPFCVSSFSVLLKEQGFRGFVLPNITEPVRSVLCCTLFMCFILIVKLTWQM